MIIGIPKEIKSFENRVGLIPFYVKKLVEWGHQVIVQKGAGRRSGIDDSNYIQSGAQIVDSLGDVYQKSDLIIKVKEPQEREYSLIQEKQAIFSFFHYPSSQKLLEGMLARKCITITYETLETNDFKRPILTPMSSIAGKLSIQIGMNQLENITGGKGVLLGGISGVETGNVVILGGGIVGMNACYVASHLHARVTLLDISLERLREIHHLMPNNVELLYSNEENITNAIKKADLVIGAVHHVGKKPPILVSEDMVKQMERNSVIVDVAIDQGGCIETSTPTTHLDPTYKVHDVIHYCVPNMPSLVSKTSTAILSHASFPYIKMLATNGIHKAIQNETAIKRGVNTWGSDITNKNVAETFNMSYRDVDDILSN